MTFFIRLSTAEEALLERAAKALRVSKAEFARRSIRVHAAEVLRSDKSAAHLDALYIG
ncbi:hypothetical protein [Variovorax sp. KK3]|uniref:hypothetical protein n=1 Tax=Variovorax sp. KK3 TaxID=1855728 RepID=UPI0015C38972|nr:hypothetical protein [Variovorax sp. KK3]